MHAQLARLDHAQKQTRGNMPAPVAIIDCLENGAKGGSLEARMDYDGLCRLASPPTRFSDQPGKMLKKKC